jgi:lipid-A-disaccharide synthase-like uncharacterized protein
MSQNHNDFSEHSTYSERVTERFVGKDVSATPATVRVLQAVAIVGTILTYLDTYLLTDRRGWISILLGAFLCFFICRFVVRGLGARNGTARMIGFICAIFSVIGGGLGLVLALSNPYTFADIAVASSYLVLGLAWFVFDYQRPSKQHFGSQLKQ